MAPPFAELLERAAAQRPGHPAVVDDRGRSLTWAELDAEATRVAGGLVGGGVVAGTRVLIALGNRLEAVVTLLAVLRAQAVAVPADPDAADSALADLMADSGARHAVVDERVAGQLEAASARSLRLVVVDGGGPQDVVGPERTAYAGLGGGGPLPPLLDPERLAVLLYTGGTSGPPRGAMLTHRALAANVAQVAALEPPMVGPDDVVLGVLPMFHVYGPAAVLGQVLAQAATLVLIDRFDPVATLDAVAAHGCTVLPLAPRALELWRGRPELRDRLAGVRTVLSGSAPLDRDTGAAFTAQTGLAVHQGYGLTEAAPVVTSTLGVDGLGRAPDRETLGLPLPGVGLRVVDADGAPVLPGDPGEIEIRGDNLFSGYWPDGADGPGPDGWWATGDLGLLDEDGALSMVDRLRERLTVAGFAVYPHEVEEVLRQVAGVAEVAVIGVPHAGTGQAVVAYAVARDDTDPQVLAAALREAVATGLAEFKRPTRIEIVDRLPLTGTGHVQKGRLRQLERRRVTGLLP